MNSPRIVVFGYSDVGYACLEFLLGRGENVAAVYTHSDKPGENLWFPSVRALAEEFSIPVVVEEKLSDAGELERLRSFSPDLIFSFYYRNLIPNSVLSLPSLGAFNMHGSLLPRFRGRAPVNWAVLMGESKTGATLHAMVEKADAGDIVDQEAVSIGPDDTAAVVQARVTRAAVRILDRQIDSLKKGTAPRHRQDPTLASTFGRRRPEDGQIDWNWPAKRIHDLVRAVTHPYPGAFAPLAGRTTWIWATRIVDVHSDFTTPGQAIVADNRLFVCCGKGTVLEILRAQPEGREEISGWEWARQAGIGSMPLFAAQAPLSISQTAFAHNTAGKNQGKIK